MGKGGEGGLGGGVAILKPEWGKGGGGEGQMGLELDGFPAKVPLAADA